MPFLQANIKPFWVCTNYRQCEQQPALPCPAQTAELECLQTRSVNPGSVIYTSFPCLYSHLHISSSWRFCALIFSPLSMPAPAARGALAPWQTSAAAGQKCWGRCSIPEIFSIRMRAFPSRMRAFHAAKLAPHLSARVSLSPQGLSAGFILQVARSRLAAHLRSPHLSTGVYPQGSRQLSMEC